MRTRRKRWMAIAAAAAAALVWLHPGLGHDNAIVAQSNAQPVAGDLATLPRPSAGRRQHRASRWL